MVLVHQLQLEKLIYLGSPSSQQRPSRNSDSYSDSPSDNPSDSPTENPTENPISFTFRYNVMIDKIVQWCYNTLSVD